NTSFTNLTIKIGSVSYSSFPSGTYETNLTTVYSAPTTTFASITSGSWVKFTLQTPFLYDPSQSFVVELSQTGYSSGFSLNSGSVANHRTYGAVGSSSGTADASHAAFGFDLIPAVPCTAPPVAG